MTADRATGQELALLVQLGDILSHNLLTWT